MTQNKKIGTTEAMRLSGVTRATLINHIKKGNIPGHRSLNKWIIEYEGFKKWMKDNSLVISENA